MALTATPAVNQAIAAAHDLPSLISELNAVDPALATQIEGKALIASKTPWGTLAAAVVAWAAARYGLGWDADTDALVAGLGLVAGSFAMRAITTSPIAGWFAKAPAVAPSPAAKPATPV